MAMTDFHLLAFGCARRRLQQFWWGHWLSVTRRNQVRGGWGGRPGGVIGSGTLSGVLDRSLFGGAGGTSSLGLLSQGRLSHQLGSLGGGKIQSDLSSAENITQLWVMYGKKQTSCSKQFKQDTPRSHLRTARVQTLLPPLDKEGWI